MNIKRCMSILLAIVVTCSTLVSIKITSVRADEIESNVLYAVKLGENSKLTEDSTLTAVVTNPDGDILIADVDYTTEWFILDNGYAESVSILSEYTIQASDIGKTLVVSVTGIGVYSGEVRFRQLIPDLHNYSFYRVNVNEEASFGIYEIASVWGINGDILALGSDYSISWNIDGLEVNDTACFTAMSSHIGKEVTYTITGLDKYSGKSVTETFLIEGSSYMELSTAEFSQLPLTSGMVVSPLVRDTEGNTLIYDTDYTLEWSIDGISVGVDATYSISEAEVDKTLTAVATAIIPRVGTAEVSAKINASAGNTITSVEIQPSTIIAGTEVTTMVTAKSMPVVFGVDYTLEWFLDDISVATTATYVVNVADLGKSLKVVATGIDPCYGIVEATYITEKPVSIELGLPSFAKIYDKNTSSMSINVVGLKTTSGVELSLNKDFTIEWFLGGVSISKSNSVKLTSSDLGKALTYTVTGIGTYVDKIKTGTVDMSTIADAGTLGTYKLNDTIASNGVVSITSVMNTANMPLSYGTSYTVTWKVGSIVVSTGSQYYPERKSNTYVLEFVITGANTYNGQSVSGTVVVPAQVSISTKYFSDFMVLDGVPLGSILSVEYVTNTLTQPLLHNIDYAVKWYVNNTLVSNSKSYFYGYHAKGLVIRVEILGIGAYSGQFMTKNITTGAINNPIIPETYPHTYDISSISVNDFPRNINELSLDYVYDLYGKQLIYGVDYTAKWYINNTFRVEGKYCAIYSQDDGMRYRIDVSGLGLYTGDNFSKTGYITYYTSSSNPVVPEEVLPSSTNVSVPPLPDYEQPPVEFMHNKSSQGVHKKYMNPYTDGTFRPNSPVTRAELALAIATLLAPNATGHVSIPKDVKSTDWGYSGIVKVLQAGFMSSDSKGNFRPKEYATRYEVAQVLYTAREYNSAQLTPTQYVPSPKDTIETGFNMAVNFCLKYGIIEIPFKGNFNGSANVSRGDLVVYINRFLNRCPDSDKALNYATMYSDVSPSDWRFSDIIEASHEHWFEMYTGVPVEVWSN